MSSISINDDFQPPAISGECVATIIWDAEFNFWMEDMIFSCHSICREISGSSARNMKGVFFCKSVSIRRISNCFSPDDSSKRGIFLLSFRIFRSPFDGLIVSCLSYRKELSISKNRRIEDDIFCLSRSAFRERLIM